MLFSLKQWTVKVDLLVNLLCLCFSVSPTVKLLILIYFSLCSSRAKKHVSEWTINNFSYSKYNTVTYRHKYKHRSWNHASASIEVSDDHRPDHIQENHFDHVTKIKIKTKNNNVFHLSGARSHLSEFNTPLEVVWFIHSGVVKSPPSSFISSVQAVRGQSRQEEGFTLYCEDVALEKNEEEEPTGELSAGTWVHDHVGINLQHHVLVLVKVENGERRHLLRHAARLRDSWNHTNCTHYALDGGMVWRL